MSRWLFGFIDLVSLPVLVPLLICFLMLLFRGFSGDADYANFTLLWLIPVGALRALSWSALNDPVLLVMTPLLWTALAVGITFFINWIMRDFRWYIIAAAALCIIALPVSAAATYWAFFSQQTLLGFGLLVVTNVPLGLSFVFERNN